MSPSLAWLLIPLIPLLAATTLLSRWRDRLVPWLWLSSVPALVISIWPPPVLYLEYLWPGAAWGILDFVGRGWLAFTALVWTCATLFAATSVPSSLRFWIFWLPALSGNLLLVVAQDALSFYVGFSLMSLAAYGLVVHLGGPNPRRAGRIYLQLAITGEMLLFAALVMRAHSAGGSLNLALWQTLPVDMPTLVLLVLGFGLKMGFWPLHFWLPLAHPAAPSPASAVLSGVMIEAGVLGLWRTLPVDDPLLQQWAGTLLMLGFFSAFYGVLIGVVSTQAKAVLAYSSISQMGYFLIILALTWRMPEHTTTLALLLVLFAAHHGVAKGALFLATGCNPPRVGVGFSFGLGLLLALPALALAGLPLTSGAALKTALKHWLGESEFANWSMLLIPASIGTTLLVTRALWLMRETNNGSAEKQGSLSMLLAWGLLSLAPVILPWLLPPFRDLLHATLSWHAVWEGSWPIGLALGISLLVVQRRWRVPKALRHWQTPALPFSVKLKRLLGKPPLPAFRPQLDWHWWRNREREWNRFWNRRDTIASSAWLVCAILIIALLW